MTIRSLASMLVFLGVVSAAAAASAQERDAGVVVGLNVSNVDFNVEDASVSLGNRGGFIIGGFFNQVVRQAFSVEVDALISMKGSSLSAGRNKFDLNLTYLDLPVLARYNIPVSGGPRIHLFAGPSFDFKLRATASASGSTPFEINEDVGDDIKAFEVGLVFGGAVRIHERAHLDVRYARGLTSIARGLEDVDGSAKNKVFSVMVAFRIK